MIESISKSTIMRDLGGLHLNKIITYLYSHFISLVRDQVCSGRAAPNKPFIIFLKLFCKLQNFITKVWGYTWATSSLALVREITILLFPNSKRNFAAHISMYIYI